LEDGLSTIYNQVDNMNGLSQVENKKSVSTFQKYLETPICSYLFGIKSEASTSSVAILNRLEFSRQGKNIIGVSNKQRSRQEKYVFSEDLGYAVVSMETVALARKFSFEAKYANYDNFIMPQKWTYKLFEHGALIQQRDGILESVSIKKDDKTDIVPAIPNDTLIIQRTNGKESYSRLTSGGVVVPIDRRDRSLSSTDIEKKYISNWIGWNRGFVLLLSGLACVIFTFVIQFVRNRQRRISSSQTSPKGVQDAV
jgi:peroxiredoxin